MERNFPCRSRHDFQNPISERVQMRTIPLSILLALLLCLSWATADEDLLAVWHLDEGSGVRVLDSSGNGLHGTVVGAEWIEGRFGSALAFDGEGAHVLLPGVGALPEGTVEAWVRGGDLPGGQGGPVSFGAGAGGRNDAAVIGRVPGGEGAAGRWGFGICPHDWHSAHLEQDVPSDEWVLMTGTWGPAGIYFYLNGRPAPPNTGYTAGLPSHAHVLLGAGSWNAYFKGAVDEVRVYRRQMPPGEVLARFSDPAYVAHPLQITAAQAFGPRPEVNAADFFDPDSPSSGLQEAIDSLGRSGGVVNIPAGTYVLHRSLRLRANTTLRGVASATILQKAPEVMSLLVQDGSVGDRTIEVQNASGFAVGTEIAVMDDRMRGWYMTHAIIEHIEGNVIHLDMPLHKEMALKRNALAITYFAGVWIDNVHNCTVENLTFDGLIEQQPSTSVTCFTLAAIHTFGANNTRIINCTVRDWPGDGIGVQAGRNNLVTGCIVSGCRGNGYHPGTGIQDSVWTNLTGINNLWDGLYFCAHCRNVVVSNSVFTDNGRNGIGGLGEGNDKFNTVIGNICNRNGIYGIAVVQGTHNTVTGNTCMDNSQREPGRYGGILIHNSTHAVVTSNRCGDTTEARTQKHGIVDTGTSTHNLIVGNMCTDNGEEGLVTIGPDNVVSGNLQ